MKNLLRLLTLVAFAATAAFAGDKPITYVAEMSGMICAGCKDHVTASFNKLEGVSNVQIVPGDKPGTQKVTVTTTSSTAFTKEQAVAALGSSASTYIVHTWKKSE